jgi:hypothetical protein
MTYQMSRERTVRSCATLFMAGVIPGFEPRLTQ